MSETIETTVELPETSETSFAQELIKTASINAAATAGTLMGLVAIGFAASKIQSLRARRAAKKADTVPPTTE